MEGRKINIEGIVLCVAAALSGLVAIADLFGLLSSVPWFQRHLPSITLVLLGSLTGFVVITISKRLTALSSAVSELKTVISDDSISSLSNIEEHVDPALKKVLGDYITGLRSTLQRSLTEKVVEFHDVDLFRYFWKRTLTQLSGKTDLVFTSLPYQKYFWASGSYERPTKDFVASGGTMKRIFFLNGFDELKNDDVRRVLLSHCECGVDVFVTDVNTVPPHLHKLLLADKKKRIGCQVAVGATNEIIKTEATADPNTIQSYIKVFENLLDLPMTRRWSKDEPVMVDEAV